VVPSVLEGHIVSTFKKKSALKMEAIYAFETLITVYMAT
jgi:hypothetical protein